ncbi:MAG: hypothetical protein WC184_08435 [Acidimicrobiia bacterium]
MPAVLAELAESLKAELASLVELAIGIKDAFALESVAGRADYVDLRTRNAKSSSSNLRDYLPLSRKEDENSGPYLFLKASYKLSMDDEGEHLMVETSSFGLWTTLRKKNQPVPVFRVEYDRRARQKPNSHVHIHAESVELGWVYGSAGLPLRRHEEIHFPLGGHRFRPTFEELLLFLDREDLFRDWSSKDWKAHVQESLERFRANQAKATVRRYTDEAIEVLRSAGYKVTDPASQP